MSSKFINRVIVVGGGLAGCSAAIEAANAGSQVILLEKESRVGGNSAKATSGINAWGTRAQAQQGVSDGGKFFERDTFLSGKGGSCDAGLVKMLSVKSAEAIEWLSNFNIPLTVLSQLGGASRKRCHRAPDKSDGTPVPIGFMTMRTLETFIRQNLSDSVEIRTNCRLTKILYEPVSLWNGQVIKKINGVRFAINCSAVTDANNLTNCTEETLEADAVILATGGFSNDRTSHSLLQEFAPQLASFPTTNGAWATGDGVKMARELGVELIDMDKVQLHPTGLIDPKDPANRTKYLGPEALRGSGGVLINKNGERFVNELDLRSVVSQAIIAQDNVFPNSGGSRFAYCILNEQAAKLFGKNALGFYWKKLGLFERVENIEELAKLIGCSQETLITTLTQYEKLSSEGLRACPSTGKNVFPCVLGPQGPFYVAYVTPSIHYTMGGCLITPSAEILSAETDGLTKKRQPIPGLFGAGEVTGGVHGKNRLGGNSLLECVVFGRIAGERAAHLNSKRSIFNSNNQFESAESILHVREVNSEFNVDYVGMEVAHQVVLNLPSSNQVSGLNLLQSIEIKSIHEPENSVKLIPCSSPEETGMIRIHISDDYSDHPSWLSLLHAGDKVSIKSNANSYSIVSKGKSDRKQILEDILRSSHYIYVISLADKAAGPSLQLMHYLVGSDLKKSLKAIRLLYSAEFATKMPYRNYYRDWEQTESKLLKVTLALDKPAFRWSGEVGAVNDEILHKYLPDINNTALLEKTAVIVLGDDTFNKNVLDYLYKENYTPTSTVAIVNV